MSNNLTLEEIIEKGMKLEKGEELVLEVPGASEKFEEIVTGLNQRRVDDVIIFGCSGDTLTIRITD